MARAVAFTGPSNSGKTTLIVKLTQALTDKMQVCVIKHDPKDKAVFDISGKDSDQFFKAGANVGVLSPSRFSKFERKTLEYKEAISAMMPFDMLFVEGLKTWDLPRIGVFRGSFDAAYTPYIDAVAVDESVQNLPNSIVRLNLNDTNDILAWIDLNAKEIS